MVARAAERARAEEEPRREVVAGLGPLPQGVRLRLGETAVLDGCGETLEGRCLVGVLELLLRHAKLLRDGCVKGVALRLRVEDARGLGDGSSRSDRDGSHSRCNDQRALREVFGHLHGLHRSIVC